MYVNDNSKKSICYFFLSSVRVLIIGVCQTKPRQILSQFPLGSIRHWAKEATDEAEIGAYDAYSNAYYAVEKDEPHKDELARLWEERWILPA